MKLGTHSGSFHADDVMGIAILKWLFPEAHIVRSRDPLEWETCDYLVDVGNEWDPQKGRFDHHQPSCTAGRERDGLFIPYAGAGLVWSFFGASAVKVIVSQYAKGYVLPDGAAEQIAEYVDSAVIQYIDMADVGLKLPGPYEASLTGVIGMMNSTIFEEEVPVDVKFGSAVAFAKGVLKNVVLAEVAKLFARDKVLEANRICEGKVIVLEESLPWDSVVVTHPELSSVLYVVYPERSGESWMIQAVRASSEGFASRKLLPASWGGLRDTAFSAVVGIDDGIFCHKGRFIAGAKSLESLLHLAKLAVEEVG